MIAEFKKIELLPEGSVISQLMADIHRKFYEDWEQVIANKLKDKGVDILDTEFLRQNVQRINIEGDKFEHYYVYLGTDKEERILSIERTPNIDFTEADTVSGNSLRVSVNCKYY